VRPSAADALARPARTRQGRRADGAQRAAGRLIEAMSSQRAAARGAEFDAEWLAQHLARERREASVLSEIREAVFGAQDGLTSVLTVVSTVGGATGQTFDVLIAGLAATLAGVFSMAAGEYMSSKSQREIFEAQIATEAQEVDERPGEAEAEVAFMLQEEGLAPDAAARIVRELATSKRALLKTMVEKELGLTVEGDANALRGALVMGASFGLAALVPILPYVFMPVQAALYVSVSLAALVLFGMGALKSRWTRRNWLTSGLEIFALGAFAGVAGYFFGTLLPSALGVAGIPG
jgi:vacuolar iron transporter family protein